MTTLHQLFLQIDAACRNHHEPHRWRVTMRDDTIEVFRRPLLTSDVTLGALGIGTAPMPVPLLFYVIYPVPAEPSQTPTQWCIIDQSNPHHTTHTAATPHAVVRTITTLLNSNTSAQ